MMAAVRGQRPGPLSYSIVAPGARRPQPLCVLDLDRLLQHSMPRTTIPPDSLLDLLVARRRLLSYMEAVSLLIPEHRQASYRASPASIIRFARKSKTVDVNGLQIHLDALIASAARKEPTEAQCQKQGYSLGDWRRVFGGWEWYGGDLWLAYNSDSDISKLDGA